MDDNGADSTPLHFAVQRANAEMVEILLKSGVLVDAKDKSGRTPLHLATDEAIPGNPTYPSNSMNFYRQLSQKKTHIFIFLFQKW